MLTQLQKICGYLAASPEGPIWAVQPDVRARAGYASDHDREQARLRMRSDWRDLASPSELDSEMRAIMADLEAGKAAKLYVTTKDRVTAFGRVSINIWQPINPGEEIAVPVQTALWLLHRYPWLVEDAENEADEAPQPAPRPKRRSE